MINDIIAKMALSNMYMNMLGSYCILRKNVVFFAKLSCIQTNPLAMTPTVDMLFALCLFIYVYLFMFIYLCLFNQHIKAKTFSFRTTIASRVACPNFGHP